MVSHKSFWIILVLVLLSVAHETKAQVLAEMTTDTVNLLCSEDCFVLEADIFKPKKTSSYSVSSIPYTPQSFTGGTSLSLPDDKFSSAINIGFDFCFYQNTYNALVIGANGVVTFTSTYGGQNCSFSTKQSLPYFNSTFPDNAIFGPFVDVNFSQGGNINYYMSGTAPWRQFVINYNSANFFSTSCPNVLNTFQIVLYESSNEVEVNIDYKGTCNSDTTDWLNYASLGIQNIGATNAVVAAGKNASIWTSNDESYKFTPTGTDAYSIEWFKNGISIGVGADTLSTCDAFPNNSYYYFEYTLDCPAQLIRDTAVVIKPEIFPDSVVAIPPTCPNSSDGSITIYPAVYNYGYSLNGGTFQSNNSFTNLANGLYVVAMQDSNGCIWDTTIYFQATSTLAISLDSTINPDCAMSNGSIYTHAVGGVAPYSYSWAGGPNTSSISNIGGGTYSVTVTDAVGCTFTLPVLLNELSGISIDSIVTTNALCGDSSGKAVIYVNGGSDYLNFTWYPNVSSTDSGINLPANTYIVQVSDTNGCDTFLNFVLIDEYVVTAFLDTIHTSCGEDNGIAYITPAGGLAPYTYAWSAGSTDSFQTGLAAGVHDVTVTAANGCQYFTHFYINNSIGPSISSSYSNAYCDSNNGNAIVFVNDMVAPISYLWSDNQLTSAATDLSPGTYWVTVTDSLGCILTDTMLIEDDGSPHLEVVAYTPPHCHGDSTASVTLSATGGTPPYKYSADGLYFTTVAQLDNMPGGTYPLYVRDANSCTKDTLINFPQPDPITFTMDNEAVVCFGDIVDMWISSHSGGTGDLTFGLDSNRLRSDTNIYHQEAGNYRVYAKDSFGCIQWLDYTIAGPSAPLDVEFDMERIPCYQDFGGQITANVSGGWGGYDILWDNGSTLYTQTDLEKNWYAITITDAGGCEITDSVELKEEECCEAFLPNAFTPDDDGKNDVFKILTRADISTVKFDIYNRGGQNVFHTILPYEGWDGTYNGKKLDMGVYFYYLRYQCPFSTEWLTLSGDVTLIR